MAVRTLESRLENLNVNDENDAGDNARAKGKVRVHKHQKADLYA